jgi:antitoxin (DNA-binding transcriptional repressor) of toxin-antitoxin stability system
VLEFKRAILIMPEALSITEAASHFREYIDRVAHRGESFVLLEDATPVAELRPLPVGRRLSELPALLASLPHLGADDVARFAADLDHAREQLGGLEVRDPWGS